MSRNSKFAKQALDKLYAEKDETGDVTFLVNSKSIRAHRCILAAFSPKYKAQFYGANPQHGDITVVNTSIAAFNEFLQLFYLADVSLTVENIESVLDLVKQSLVDEFIHICTDFLIKIMRLDNLCWGYRLSLLYDIKPLQSFCEQRIIASSKKLFTTNDFQQCDREVLAHILMVCTLYCGDIELFDACILWAKAACIRNHMDPDNAINLRNELGERITRIRFGPISVGEFIDSYKSGIEMFGMPAKFRLSIGWPFPEIRKKKLKPSTNSQENQKAA